MPVGSPDQVLSVIRKHRKSVESFVERDLLKSATIAINEVQIKIRTSRIRIVHVRRKDDLAAVRMKIWREVRRTIVGELSFIAAVGTHEHDFELRRHNEILCKQILILSDFFRRFRPACTPHDILAVL
jgi:hypothetical protein